MNNENFPGEPRGENPIPVNMIILWGPRTRVLFMENEKFKQCL